MGLAARGRGLHLFLPSCPEVTIHQKETPLHLAVKRLEKFYCRLSQPRSLATAAQFTVFHQAFK